MERDFLQKRSNFRRMLGQVIAVTILIIFPVLMIAINGQRAMKGILWANLEDDAGLWHHGQAYSVNEPESGKRNVPRFGIYDPGKRFESVSGFDFEQLYISWLDVDEETLQNNIQSVAAAGRIPLLTIEPWAFEGSEKELLQDIIAGKYDQQMSRIFKSLSSYQGELYVSWGHEMDQDLTIRYHWSAKDPELFIKTYRYVADYFNNGLQADIRWIWAPVAKTGSGRYYPGNDYVDYIGFPIYSLPEWDKLYFGYIRSFDTWFDEKYANIRQFDKPIMIVEFGVSGSDDYRAYWMQQAFLTIRKITEIDAVVFFHAQDTPGAWGSLVATPDWRSPESLIIGFMEWMQQ
jgi:beta-mannanase